MLMEILCAFVAMSSFHNSPSEHMHESRTGLIIPLYDNSSSAWDELIMVKHNHHTMPVITIINPNNGPGQTINSNYVQGVENLQSGGIVVLGYVEDRKSTR